jgi:NAD(P)H-hydrate epimerase
VRDADYYAINNTGFPGIVLMENASIEIFNLIKENLPDFSENMKIGIVCGKGNNGGDGFALARHFLNNGNPVSVCHFSKPEEMPEDANTNFTILTKYKDFSPHIDLTIKKINTVKDLKPLEECGVVVDAILGSGAAGELKDLYAKTVEKLNAINAFKIAVDIPTGLNANTGWGGLVFNADLTVTLAAFKPGLFISNGSKFCGKIVKGRIGIFEKYFDFQEVSNYLIEPEDAFYCLPVKNKTADKYSAGSVFIIAGSEKYAGAPLLASKAAFKAGAGAVTLAFPEGARPFPHNNIAELVCEFYNSPEAGYLTENALPGLISKAGKADVTLLGPGLGRNNSTVAAVREFVKNRGRGKLIIDADAIRALGKGEYKNYDIEGVVFTPHLGEFANLTDIDINIIKTDLLRFAREFTATTGAYLVLKGAPTLIANPEGEIFINSAGNPGMAKFGTGDALSGVIAAFAAQKEDVEEALIASVYLHSLSADLLLNEYSEFGFTATDIIDNFPKSIIFLRNSIV